MKGVITKWDSHFSDGWITDEMGREYFFHFSGCNFNSVRKGLIVEFEPIDEGKKSLKAVNINKIGLGTRHPFYNDCQHIIEFIEANVPDSEERRYRIRDLKTMANYFKVKEELLPDGRNPYLEPLEV